MVRLLVNVQETAGVEVAASGVTSADGYGGKSEARSRTIVGSHESMPAKVSPYDETERMKNGLCSPDTFMTPAMLPAAVPETA